MKTIILKSNGVGRYIDVSPYLIVNESIEIEVKLPAVNGEFYLFADCGGHRQKYLLPANGKAVVCGICAGELSAEVKHYLKGELVKTYVVEPLLLKELDVGISAEPEIAFLKAEILSLNSEFVKEREKSLQYRNEYIIEIEKCKERVEKQRAIIFALLRFAYVDFKENVYLGGGGVQDFLKRFGFELSLEEIKFLEGENNEN